MKIGGKAICPYCGGEGVCIGGLHYEKTGEGMGHEVVKTAYQCKDCKVSWKE